jgi:fluoroquinolone transport system permease protein
MRMIIHATISDIRFQMRQGISLVYVFITLVYLLVLGRLPEAINGWVVPLLVYSDPAMLGFFFIGGIVMLEKSQGVIQYLTVTPLAPMAYLLAKTISLGLVSMAAGLAIVLVTYHGTVVWITLLVGILLSSAAATSFGFFVAAGCRTVNAYFVRMIPAMLLLVAPTALVFFPALRPIACLLPSSAGLLLVLGAFRGITILEVAACVVSLLIWDALLLKIAENSFVQKIAVEVES